jgi:triosephosphate isomerase
LGSQGRVYRQDKLRNAQERWRPVRHHRSLRTAHLLPRDQRKGLLPIICVGETLDERKTGKLFSVVEGQTKGAFAGISKADALTCTVAYEPVWAIGTGEVATPDQANEMHMFIRKQISSLYDTDTAGAVRIQYGGSMKPDNAKALLALSDVDGGLIGGAALKADDFFGIVKPK